MRGAIIKDITLRIWEMSRKGKSVQEIASELGVNKHTVAGALTRGRNKGVIPRPDRNYATSYMLSKFGMKGGSIISLMDHLSMEQRVWLVSEAKKINRETIEEYLLEKIRDEHEESNQRK